ncbi:hypothetical protein AX16_006667 [Volvariella volvacea WC 439]|nr:hypothetical protein AX16_006667 [Volvariella volvacea WC 439]
MFFPPRAYVFGGLNVVRAISIIALILVFASTIFVMTNNIKAVNNFEANKGNTEEDCDYIEGSTVPIQPAGVFWAIMASLLIIFQTIILFLSEIGWPSKFFDRFFPVLGSDFGLGPLGIFQCLIATQILSHHVDDFTLVAAFFLFSIGCLNILLGLIFRQSAKSKRSILSWREEKKGILPTIIESRLPPGTHIPGTFSFSFPGTKSKSNNNSRNSDNNEKSGYPDFSGMGFGRQAEKAAGLRGFVISKPEESLPRYATTPYLGRNTSSSSRSSSPPSSRGGSRSGSPTRMPMFKSSNTAL